jgi:hypothetical protein
MLPQRKPIICNPQEVISPAGNKAQVEDLPMKEITQESELVTSPSWPRKRGGIKKLLDMHVDDVAMPSDGNVQDGTTQSLLGNLEVENVIVTCGPSNGQNSRSMSHEEEIAESPPKKALSLKSLLLKRFLQPQPLDLQG